MSDERSRTREPEPEQEETQYDQMSAKYAEDRERLDFPYVRKGQNIPWEISRHSKVKRYSYPFMDEQVCPDIKVFRQEIPDRNGRHTHQGGVAIFGLAGDAKTVADGEEIPWGPGDLVILPITPGGGVEHQHFNRNDPSDPAEWLAIRYEPLKRVVGTERIQNETAPWHDDDEDHDHTTDPNNYDFDFEVEDVDYDRWLDYQTPDDVDTLYGDLFDRRNRFRQELARSWERDRWVKIAGEDLEWEWNPQGKMKWYMHPAFDDRGMKTLIYSVQEIPPGSRSGRQHRQGGIVHYILQGEGHTVVNGDRYDWEEHDFFGLPVCLEGHTIQHFNDDTEKPVQFLRAEPYVHDAVGYDRGSGLEQLEPCPEYGDDLPTVYR